MRIAILIPSRNRPRLLSAAITALHEMESGDNEVSYCIGIDADDPITKEVVVKLQSDDMDVSYQISSPESLTIGSIWNNLTNVMTGAEIYSCMIDDAFPITPHWDKHMVAMAEQYEAFSWWEISAPSNVGYPTCTKAWLDRVGYISQDFWPYWFFDTAFAELVWFATNSPVPVSQQLALFSKQEATQNLRDLDWWWRFFAATRPIRVMEAHRLVGGDVSLEDFTASRGKWIMLGEQRDAQFIGSQRLKGIEVAKGATGEPSARYIAAKERAQKYLDDHGLKIG